MQVEHPSLTAIDMQPGKFSALPMAPKLLPTSLTVSKYKQPLALTQTVRCHNIDSTTAPLGHLNY